MESSYTSESEVKRRQILTNKDLKRKGLAVINIMS